MDIEDAKRRSLLRQFGAATLAACGLPAQARATPLRLVVIDQMPWAGRDAGGGMQGAAVELARQLSVISGLAVTMRALPYARAAAMISGGDADLMLAVDTGPHSGLSAPVDTLGQEDIIVIGRAGAHYANLHELHGLTVGHMRRAAFDADFYAKADIVKYEINSYGQGVQMLLQNRLDALLGSRNSIGYALRKLQVAPARVGAPFLLRQASLCLYVSAQAATPALLACLHSACRHLHRKKQLPALLAQYRQL